LGQGIILFADRALRLKTVIKDINQPATQTHDCGGLVYINCEFSSKIVDKTSAYEHRDIFVVEAGFTNNISGN
jgi:hypothetical protein